MGIGNKIVVGAVLLLYLVVLFASIASVTEASYNVTVTSLDVSYDMVSYTWYMELENVGDKNITVAVGVFSDDSKIAVCEDVVLNINYFYGFQIPTRKTVGFEVPNEEGYHTLDAVILIGNTTIIVSDSYEAYGEVVEEEVEEAEDWLKCP